MAIRKYFWPQSKINLPLPTWKQDCGTGDDVAIDDAAGPYGERSQDPTGAGSRGFDFLGHSIGCFHDKDGVSCVGTKPSLKAGRKLLQKSHNATTSRNRSDPSRMRATAVLPGPSSSTAHLGTDRFAKLYAPDANVCWNSARMGGEINR